MPVWGSPWGLPWGPLSIEVGSPEADDVVGVDDSTTVTLVDFGGKVCVGPTRIYKTIQDALDTLSANLIILAISPLDDTRIICVDPGTYPENVSIPAGIVPTAVNRLIIRCASEEDRTDPRDVVVDGGGSGDVFNISQPFVDLEGLTIRNGDVGVRVTAAGNDNQIKRNIIEDCTDGVVVEAGATDPILAVNVFQRIEVLSVSLTGIVGTARVDYNSMLVEEVSIPTPGVGIFCRTSDLTARNNIIVAKGDGAVSIPIDFDDNAAAQTIISDFNNLYRLDDAGPIVRFNGTDHLTLAAWQGDTPAQDGSSISDDPDFINVETGSVRLRLRLDTPSHRAGVLIADLLVDLFGGFRPQDLPSQGAIEPMNVILDQGRTRVLELIGGLSTDYIDRAFAGQDGTIAAMPDSPEATDRALTDLDDQIFVSPIPIERVSIAGAKVLFDVRLGPSAKLMRERLDQVIDPLSEIGLAFKDQLLFTRLTIRDTPLEPLAPVTTKVVIGIEFV